MDINPEKCSLKYFSGLIKIKQAPFEDDLIAKMQAKVDWIKKTSGYDLNQRQRESLERDKALVLSVEAYVSIQHQIITHLFEKLEQAQTECAAHLSDKHHAEKELQDFIKRHNEREIQPTA